uniref:Taurocyamine kinase n=1 Tax=Dugesia sp. BJR-2013 TaxID=1350396 RepID=S4VGM4_9PLAT|nr:taurocyamine kinase [Dugesia sp. BJR-2013]
MDVPTLEELYHKIQNCKSSKSFTKKHLTKEIVDKYKNVKTDLGGSLALCVRTNSMNPGAMLPRCADIDCYNVFTDFFEAVIKDYHKITTPSVRHPEPNFGNLDNLGWGNLDPTGKFVVSTRVRVGRTVQGFAFAPLITKTERLELEQRIIKALNKLSEELNGNYYPLSSMNRYTYDKLVDDHFFFRDDDSVLRDAGGYRDWPTGRGIYLNHKNNFLVWVNEEDHLRIISMESGGDLSRVYRRLVKGIKTLEENLGFARHQRYGYLTFCPSNLGTTMRASVHVRIPMVSSLPNFKEICQKYQLQARGTYGEHTESLGGIYDLSNQRRLGYTEIEAAQEMAVGVKEIVELEATMQEFNKNTNKNLMLVESLEYMYKLLNVSENKSLTKKYLTLEKIKKLKDLRTSKGTSLAHCVRNCAYNPRALCPRTGDAECYTLFQEYLDLIIMDYHLVLDKNFQHPDPFFGDTYKLPFHDLDPSGEHILSTRVRVGRSIKGFNFPPTIDKAQRLRLESIVSEALMGLPGDLSGNYYPLTGMDEKTQKQLIDDHFLFKDDDPVLRDAGGYRDWPSGRGIFHNTNKTFLVWVCEEDHIRIISMQKGGDLPQVYQRLVLGIRTIEEKMPFAHMKKYGYLTCCPSNLGTTMRASVHVKIPKLSSNQAKFSEVCDKYHLQARGLYGEHTESVGGVYDISNKHRLGLTELDAATEMANGVKAIIDIEKSL